MASPKEQSVEGAPSKLRLGGVFACSAPADAAYKIPTLVAKDATRMGHPRLLIFRPNQTRLLHLQHNLLGTRRRTRSGGDGEIVGACRGSRGGRGRAAGAAAHLEHDEREEAAQQRRHQHAPPSRLSAADADAQQRQS